MWSREIDELGMLSEGRKGMSCARMLRLVLLALMLFILVGGIAILGIGIWTHEVEYGSKVLTGLIGVRTYQADSVIMIASGTATLVIITIGLLGLLMPQKCLLGLHLSLVTFLAMTLFAAGILGYVFVRELEESVRGSMKKSIVEKYGLPTEPSITASWDSVQQTFSCCGAYGGENTTTSWYLFHLESFWVKEKYNINGSYVPDSCCQSHDQNIDMCTGRQNITENWPPRTKPPIVAHPTNYTMYTTGCFDKLKGYLEQNGILIGTAAVVVGVFMIVEVVLAGFAYRSLH